MLKIAHIINPVHADPSSELAQVQPFTFESMRQAKEKASAQLDVELLCTQYEEDIPAIPEGFKNCGNLERSAMDIQGAAPFKQLPFLQDILERMHQAVHADVYLYSNVDIIVTPDFYLAIAAYHAQGIDAMTIHRRRVEPIYESVDQLPLIFAESGLPHSGFDTFAYDAGLASKIDVGEVVIGIPHVGNCLAHNLMAHAQRFEALHERHLCIHLGMELTKNWGPQDLQKHNYTEFRKRIKELGASFSIANFPYSSRSLFARHFKWLMNPNFHYPTMLKLDLQQFAQPRRKKKDENVNSNYHEWLSERMRDRDKI